jgi:serine/threonine protein kinase
VGVFQLSLILDFLINSQWSRKYGSRPHIGSPGHEMASPDTLGLDILSQQLEAVLTASNHVNVSSGPYVEEESPDDDPVIPLKVATAELINVVNNLNLESSGLLNTYNSLHWNLSGFVTTTIASGSRFHVCNLREIKSTPVCAKYPVLRKIDQTGALGVGKRVLNDIKQELHILCHKPIRKHRNIVKIRGLGWMDVGTPGLLSLPVVFLEMAQLGSLEAFLNLNHPGPRLRARLVEDVGNGLLALHSSSIIHGDLKPDNILVCVDESRSLVAKIADFGSSNIASALLGSGEYDLDEEVHQGRGASALWNAPEWRMSMSLRGLFSCDAYSFGLVAWSICTVAPNPFGFLDIDAIERLKSQNLVIRHACRAVQDYYAFESSAWGPEVPNGELLERHLVSVVIPREIFMATLDVEPSRRSLQKAVSAASLDDLYG